MWSRLNVVEQILDEKLILLAGFDEKITKICSVDHIEEEIEVADEIRSRILQTKGEIAIAPARVKNGGTSSSTSSSHGSAQNHHTEEHKATNNPNQAPMPLQDSQHAYQKIQVKFIRVNLDHHRVLHFKLISQQVKMADLHHRVP